jgi:hypothetical protein
MIYRRKLNLKAEFESSISHLGFNTLSSRRFQLVLDRVNLHRLTMSTTSISRDLMPHNQGLSIVPFSA